MSETFPKPQFQPDSNLEHDWSAVFTRHKGKIDEEKQKFPEYSEEFQGAYSEEYEFLIKQEEYLDTLTQQFRRDESIQKVRDEINYKINAEEDPLMKRVYEAVRRRVL